MADWDSISRIRAKSRTERQEEENKKAVIATINERLEKKIDLNELMLAWPGHKLLHRAVHYDHTGELVLKLLKAGAFPDVFDNCGRTPLHWACNSLSPENLKILLAYNANPNTALRNSTPLHKISESTNNSSSNTQIAVKLLLAHGAHPLKKNCYGETCLQILAKYNPKLEQITRRIYHHKIAAYILLLRGKETNESLFRRLPKDLLKLILGSIFPNFPWPGEILNSAKLLDLLKSEQKQIKGDS